MGNDPTARRPGQHRSSAIQHGRHPRRPDRRSRRADRARGRIRSSAWLTRSPRHRDGAWGGRTRDTTWPALADLESEYDLIVIDTPPNLGMLTVNALVPADVVIAPVAADDEGAVQGLAELRGTLSKLGPLRPGRDAPELRVIVTRWDVRLRMTTVVEEAIEALGLPVYARIPARVAVKHASVYRRSSVRSHPTAAPRSPTTASPSSSSPPPQLDDQACSAHAGRSAPHRRGHATSSARSGCDDPRDRKGIRAHASAATSPRDTSPGEGSFSANPAKNVRGGVDRRNRRHHLPASG